MILIGDPYTMEYVPGIYAHGVSLIAQEVEKSTLPTKPKTVLLMPWPAATSTSTVDHYKEVVCRTGNTTGCMVAPAALAWQAAGSPSGATHPTTGGAYIAAATIFSSIWAQSAAVSTYNYNDTLANTAHTTVNANIGVQQYTGNFNTPGPFQINYDKRRTLATLPSNKSSDWYTTDKMGPMINENGLIWAKDVAGGITLTWQSFYATMNGSQNYLQDLPGNAGNMTNDNFIGRMSSQDFGNIDMLRLEQATYPKLRYLPIYVNYAQIHRLYPNQNPITGQHYTPAGLLSSSAFMYTMFTGRCPIGPKPNPVTQDWDAKRIGYETAWHLGRVQGRAPGFRTMPSNRDRLTIAPGQTETLKVEFALPPKANVTVNISINNGALATVSPAQLTFTPENYATAQNVVVTCLGNANPSSTIVVNFNTVSTDEVCHGLHDSWDYTRSFPPVINKSVWADVNPVMQPEKAFVNVTASDPESNALTYTWSKVSGPETVSFSPNSTTASARSEVTFSTPGTYVLKAMVSDGTSSVDGGNVTIQVLNSAPVANPQSVTVFQDSPKPIQLAATDINGDTLAYIVWDDPTHGTLSGTPPNLIYTPASGYMGNDSFTFIASDGTVNSSPATVTITVNAPNTPPGVNAGTDQTVTLGVVPWTPALLTPQLWLDGSTATINAGTVSIANAGSGGGTISGPAALVANGIGSRQAVGFNGTSQYLTGTYTNTGASLTAFFVGKSSSTTQLSSAGMMTVWANGQARDWNNIGSAVLFNQNGTTSNSLQTYRNSTALSATTGTLTNAFLAATVFSGTTNILYLNGTAATSIASTGNFSAGNVALGGRWASPAFNTWWNGNFGEAIICNANLSMADRQKVEGYLAHKWGTTANLPADHPYKTAAPTTATAVANLDGTVNDVEGDPQTTTWTLVSGPAAATISNASAVDTSASFTLTGTYVLRLNAADSYGQVFDEVTVTVTDFSGNSAPAASNISITTGENIPKAVTLTASDVQGTPLSYSIVNPPTKGTLSGTAPNLTYTPNSGTSGSDSFTFRANDGIYNSNLATVSITVIPNLAPVIVVDSPTVSAAHLAPYGGVMLETTVTDDGYPLTPGTVTLNWSKVSGPGTVTFESPTQADTAVLFSVNGTYVVRLTASDGVKQTSTNLTFYAGSYPTDWSNQGPQVDCYGTVSGAPGVPISLADASFVADEGRPFSTLVTQWRILSGPGTGAFTNPSLPATSFVCNTPGIYILRVTGYDGQIKAYDDMTVTVSGTGNAIPVGNTQSVTTQEEVAKAITLSGSDGNGNSLTFSIAGQPANGTLSGTAPNVIYTPTANFNGTDSFTFKVNDGITDSLTVATVSINVTPVNDAPIASAMSVTTNEDIRVPIALGGSDVDGDALTFSVLTQPANGVLSGTASNLKYTPNANFNGNDSFTFKATDPSGLFSQATVSLIVTPVNDVPLANPQLLTMIINTVQQVVLTGTDADGNPLTYTIVNPPSNGTLNTSNLPNVTYTPNVGFFGSDYFTFKVNDGTTDSAFASVIFNIQPVGLSSADGIVGLRQSGGAAPALGYYPGGYNAIVGGAGSNGSRLVTNVVHGHGLPILPPGAVITGANLGFDVTVINAMDSRKLSVYLLDTANPNTSGTSFFYNGPINTTATAKYLNGFTAVGAKQAVLSGEALDLLKSYYGGDHIPERPEAFFRFNLDAALAAGSLLSYTLGTTASQNVLNIQYTMPPVANAQSVTTVEGTAKSITLTGSDADGDPLTYTIVSQPTNGTLSGTVPNLTYTPNANYIGLDSFTFKVNDGKVDSTTATVSITVTSAFSAWAGGGITFGSDANGDGVADGLSWLLGGTNPQQNGNELLPQSAQSSGNLTLSFKMLNSTQRGSAVLALQYSRDLGVSDPWTNHTIPVPDVSGTVTGVNFVITPISGTDHNQVQVTIPASAAGGTGKVFARMSGMLSP